MTERAALLRARDDVRYAVDTVRRFNRLGPSEWRDLAYEMLRENWAFYRTVARRYYQERVKKCLPH